MHYMKLIDKRVLWTAWMLAALCPVFGAGTTKPPVHESLTTRQYWVATLDRIAYPVISTLARGTLKKEMPLYGPAERAAKVTYLEAFGRTFSGIAPWLELGPDESEEGRLRGRYIEMTLKAIDNATNPDSPDFMNFTEEQQPLVDAAYLAHGLLRARTQIWEKLSPQVRQRVIDCLKSTRAIRTPNNNWLLFSGIIEAFLLDIGGGHDIMRIDYAVNKHLERYKGDGVYGDGEPFHWDYYNSIAIQPMLADICRIMKEKNLFGGRFFLSVNTSYETIIRRLQRYAVIQQYSISPEGTFPPFGRSLTYRTGVFHALGLVALMGKLSPRTPPAQVRCAMTAVIRRLLEAEGTFDENGWLRIGLCGYQPSLGESYITTGSLYMCATGFLPLGLPADDPFWTDPDDDWTTVRIWNGTDMRYDYAVD